MKVKELIEQLRQFDPDTEILVYSRHAGWRKLVPLYPGDVGRSTVHKITISQEGKRKRYEYGTFHSLAPVMEYWERHGYEQEAIEHNAIVLQHNDHEEADWHRISWLTNDGWRVSYNSEPEL